MAITLADINTRARQLTNTVGSGFLDDSVEMPNYINDAVSDVYDRVVGSYELYFVKAANFTLTTSNTIALTSITGAGLPFYKEAGVDYWPSGLGGRPVTVMPIGSYENRNDGCGWSTQGLIGADRTYVLVGDSLEILPNLTAFAGTYTLHYIPSCPVLSDTVDLPVELERWVKLVVEKVSVSIKLKREQDTADLERLIAQQEKRIDNAARHRYKEGKFLPTRARQRGNGNPWGFGGAW